MIRYLILSALLLCACTRQQGFTLKKITSRTPTEKQPVHCDLERLQALFDAPLTYIGSGNHTYAFMSADKTHVIKFFKQNHFGPYTWLDYLPLPAKLNPWRQKRHQAYSSNRLSAFESLELAYKFLKEHTGLVYLHLNRTTNINRRVKLIYSDARQPFCDIDKMEFIVQKKAEVGFAHIEELLQAGQKMEAVQSLMSYLDLIRIRCQKGLADRDLQFYKNFGFIDGKPMEIDITDFNLLPAMKEKSQWVQEVKDASSEIITYIQEQCPDLLDTFNKSFEELIK